MNTILGLMETIEKLNSEYLQLDARLTEKSEELDAARAEFWQIVGDPPEDDADDGGDEDDPERVTDDTELAELLDELRQQDIDEAAAEADDDDEDEADEDQVVREVAANIKQLREVS